MQIFLSHSHHQKPLIREVRRHLPDYLGAWIDEEKLLFGDEIGTSIESAIKSDTDYLLLFIDEQAAGSSWVAKELEWTLKAEKTQNRTILLPVVIEESALRKFASIEVQNRKYLRLKDYLEPSVRALADAITSELFALVCRDMTRLHDPKPKTPAAAIADADSLVRRQAKLIQKAVFPHRKSNPITRDTLRNVVNSQCNSPVAEAEFETLLSNIAQRNFIPGLFYDGYELYLIEEHASWKAEVERNKKQRIGRRAASLIVNGMKVILDAGSTVEEVVRVICKKIETRALTRITIATTSINIADMISDCCVSMGFDDDFSAVRLYVPGGQVRSSTQAIVPMDGTENDQVLRLSDQLGGFDLGIVGVNGISPDTGFTTHDNAEALNKIHIIHASRSCLIVGDSSKIGIKLEVKFASFEDDVKLMVDEDKENPNLNELVKCYGEKVLLA